MNSAGVGHARANRYRAAKLERFAAHEGAIWGFQVRPVPEPERHPRCAVTDEELATAMGFINIANDGELCT